MYRGTSYKKGLFLVLKNGEWTEFGELLIILIQNDAAVYFVMEMYKADYHSEYHLYTVIKQSTRVQCLSSNDLVEFYPLSSYIVNGYQFIPLKHSVLSE